LVILNLPIQFLRRAIFILKLARELKLAMELKLARCVLSIFCLRAHELISNLKGDERLGTFFHYRYRLLADHYPHEPFSVEQSDFNFFLTTYQYLVGELDLQKDKPHDYKENYAKWLDLHKQTK
jgi:hypothetical protein